MLGAIAGDVIGSVYEASPVKTTDFPLFSRASTFTDDTVLTVATAEVLLTGGDADTMAAIAGAVAEARFGGVPDAIRAPVLDRLPPEFRDTIERFREGFIRTTQ